MVRGKNAVVKSNLRIVCLSFDSIDIMIALGAQHMVVGRPAGEHRPEVAHAQSIGGYGHIRADAVLALKPDLVIGYAAFQMRQSLALADAGLNVLTLSHHSLEEIQNSVTMLATITGTLSAAAALQEQFSSRIARFEARNRQREPVRVYFEEWDCPMVAAPMWISQMIQLAGGRDVFADKSRLSTFEARQVTVDEIVREDPQFIVASWCGKPVNKAAILNRPGFSNVAAARHDRIFEVNGDAFLQPGPSVINGVSILERLFHPDAPMVQHE
ncbi:MAG: ABC transporter substrate-binding protein [Deltaproteobacteria bacterium]|nr:ABC transporter substrate-binding protein [Deltaproteobacteria bacterium]